MQGVEHPKPTLRDDLDDYQRVRFDAARAVGLTRLEAARFAKGRETLHTLWKLRDEGCPARLIVQIVT